SSARMWGPLWIRPRSWPRCTRPISSTSRQARNEGVFITVPQEAQQALVFLVPETGGDFSTLRKAVHDRPGAFVRAGQDLQAASWDRNKYALIASLAGPGFYPGEPVGRRGVRSAAQERNHQHVAL